jgi:acetylornithine deacetylase
VEYVPGLKVNLYAVIGPSEKSGIVLSAHTDVVPVDGQQWISNPFDLRQSDGKLFGRGTADMKGFLACVLASVPEFVERRLRTPIVLVFSCDEEIGCNGVVPLVKELGLWRSRPQLAIVGEPSRMSVIRAHKGNMTFETEVIGVEAHSSTPLKGVNAIYFAARVVSELERIATELRHVKDKDFSPPYSTLHVGLISGGTVKNIVPGRCKITWEIRPLPRKDLDTTVRKFEQFCERLEAEMKESNSRASIRTFKTNCVPPLLSDEGGFAETLVMKLAGTNVLQTASYTTEAGHFKSIGIPTVICGPGDITQAHKPDEFVEISELVKCVSFLSRLAAFCEADDLHQLELTAEH